MPLLSFTEAARLAGVDVSTIHRRVKRGDLSAVRHPNGKRAVELAELLRVYPDLAVASGMHPGVPGHANEHAALHATSDTVALLERELAAAREREARLLAMLEQEQRTRRELEQRLLPPPRRSMWDHLEEWLERLKRR